MTNDETVPRERLDGRDRTHPDNAPGIPLAHRPERPDTRDPPQRDGCSWAAYRDTGSHRFRSPNTPRKRSPTWAAYGSNLTRTGISSSARSGPADESPVREAAVGAADRRGEKTIEIRGWSSKHRGPLLIVASKCPEVWATGCAIAVFDLVD